MGPATILISTPAIRCGVSGLHARAPRPGRTGPRARSARELPGGHVDPGESASAAAVRETAEESGITVEVTGLAGIYTDPGHVIADPRAGLVRQPFAVSWGS